jgi:hypothetical protein
MLDEGHPVDIPWLDMWKLQESILSQAGKSLFPPLGTGQRIEDSNSFASIMELSLDLITWHRTMVRNSIKDLLSEGVDLELGHLRPGDIRLFKLEPLTALSRAVPESLLYSAVKHNWNVTLFLSRIC